MREIPLGGLGGVHVAIVDDEDFEYLSQFHWTAWSLNDTLVYATRDVSVKKSKRRIFMHRCLLPTAEEVDHINHNGLDNRRSNLRPVDRTLNHRNSRKLKRQTSEFKGVSWCKQKRKWRACIAIGPRGNSRQHHLGFFESELEAARAYDSAAILYFGAYACTNFN